MADRFSFNDIDKVVNSIRQGLVDWQRKQADSKCDKLALGFNKDERFSTARFELSLDSWSGTYGSSSCGSFFYVHNAEVFKTAFVRVLNLKLGSLLEQTAELLDKDNREARAKKIAQMETELTELKEKQEKTEVFNV